MRVKNIEIKEKKKEKPWHDIMRMAIFNDTFEFIFCKAYIAEHAAYPSE